MARNGDLLGIAAEASNVLPEPLDSGALVTQPEILRLARNAGEAEYVNPVVDGDDDDVLSLGEVLAVVERTVRVANGETWFGVN